MAKPFQGTINVDIRDSEPDWTPFEPPRAPDGAPNVFYIVLDDVGFSAMSCYGGPIDTPNIDRIAAAGVRYTQWHTTAFGLEYEAADFFDDGPEKPVRIWSRIGRRPLLACGNSNGDVPMLRFARVDGRPSLRLLILHDDAEREFDYTAGAEEALERARGKNWTIVSTKDDWNTVFPEPVTRP